MYFLLSQSRYFLQAALPASNTALHMNTTTASSRFKYFKSHLISHSLYYSQCLISNICDYTCQRRFISYTNSCIARGIYLVRYVGLPKYLPKRGKPKVTGSGMWTNQNLTFTKKRKNSNIGPPCTVLPS